MVRSTPAIAGPLHGDHGDAIRIVGIVEHGQRLLARSNAHERRRVDANDVGRDASPGI